MLNDPDCPLSYNTYLSMPYCSCRVMLTNLGWHPCTAMHAQVAYLYIESNASVRSKNAKQNFTLLFTMSAALDGQSIINVRSASSLSQVTLCFGDKLSVRRCRRFRGTFARFFPATESSGIEWRFPHSVGFP